MMLGIDAWKTVPRPRTRYLSQISSHILSGEKTFEANEIRKMNKSERSQRFVVSKEKKPRDFSKNDDEQPE